jgi:hypothetical protein
LLEGFLGKLQELKDAAGATEEQLARMHA